MQYNAYGELAKLTLPTGGYYTYFYGTTSGVITLDNNSGYRIMRPLRERDEYTGPGQLSAKLVLSYPTGTAPDPNHSSRPVTAAVADIEDASNHILRKEEHYFYGNPFSTEAPTSDPTTFAHWWEGLEYNSYIKDGNDTVFKQQQEMYQQRPCGSNEGCNFNPQDDTAPAHDPQLCQQNTMLGSSGAAGEVYSYDQYNNQVFKWEYDYGQAPSISATCPAQGPNNYARVTWNTYLTDTAYTDPSVNLVSLLTYSAVNPSQGQFGNATYTYDEAGTLFDAPGIVGHDTAYDTSRARRGNPTTVSRYSSSLDKNLSTKLTYDIGGNVLSSKDPNQNSTSWSYDAGGGPMDYAHSAYATNALGLTFGTTFDWSSGKAWGITPMTGVSTAINYNSSDPLDRPQKACKLDGWGASLQACTEYQYPSLTQVTMLQWKDSSSNNVRTDLLYDGLGRLQEKDLYEDSSNYIATKQTYNALGQIFSVTSPARSGDTPATTTYQYDPLGRQTEVDYPDGSKLITQYVANTVTVTDPGGAVRRYTNDALGHVTQVQEDPSGLNYITSYAYDPLDHLSSVTQGGQTRAFTYDNLGWLMSVQNPESGTTSYTHDNVGNVVTRTDARGVQTTYVYDEIYRLKSKTYSDGTPSAIYSYNPVPNSGAQGSQSFLLAQPSQVSNGIATMTIISADRLARTAASQVVIGGQTYNFAYTYNLTGALTSETYPSGRVIYTCYDNAGRAKGVSLSSDCSSANFADNVTYAPHGGVAGYRYGNDLWRAIAYNNRLQWNKVDDMIANDTNRNLLDQQFTWTSAPSATDNNGNLRAIGISNGGGPGTTAISFGEQFTYDALNRLHTATDSGGWARTFDYDRFGNMWVSAGTDVPASTPSTPSWIDAATNRLAPVSGQLTYDAAGNLTAYYAGAGSTYDAENHMTTLAGTFWGTKLFSYDGDGRRVIGCILASSGGCDPSHLQAVWVYDVFGNLAATYSSATPSGSALATNYLTTDQIGSTRLVTDASANVISRHDYLPFGEDIGSGYGRTDTNQPNAGWGRFDGVSQLFTGQYRDWETRLDYFNTRYFSSVQGRFSSPDPINAGVDPLDPQTWNAYSYVRNSPTALTDPSGMSDCNVFNGTYEGSGSGFPCYDASVHYGGPAESLTSVGGPTGVATGSTIGSGSPELAGAEAEHASNFGWQATGLLYGKSYSQFFSSLNAYFDWRTDIAGLGESKAYNAYMADCAHSSAPCNGNDTVVERDQGPTGNYRLDKSDLDTRSMSGMILDPLYLLPVPESLKQYFHPGASWYGWSPVDTLHVAGVPNGVESHQDLFSPVYFAPLHFLFDVVPSFFINPSPGKVVATYTCSPVGGCHL
jgi:RHS repeat-associated protein